MEGTVFWPPPPFHLDFQTAWAPPPLRICKFKDPPPIWISIKLLDILIINYFNLHSLHVEESF